VFIVVSVGSPALGGHERCAIATIAAPAADGRQITEMCSSARPYEDFIPSRRRDEQLEESQAETRIKISLMFENPQRASNRALVSPLNMKKIS
jgi:hypothetical protein